MKRRQVPAFGYWDYCDELPVTHYFELQAGLIRGHYYGDLEHQGIFSVPTHTAPAYQHHHRKVLMDHRNSLYQSLMLFFCKMWMFSGQESW